MYNFHFIPSIPSFFVISKSCHFFSNKEYTLPPGGSFNTQQQDLLFRNLQPSCVTSSAVISACATVAKWLEALQLFQSFEVGCRVGMELGGAGGCDVCINLGLYIYICIFISIHIKGKEDD